MRLWARAFLACPPSRTPRSAGKSPSSTWLAHFSQPRRDEAIGRRCPGSPGSPGIPGARAKVIKPPGAAHPLALAPYLTIPFLPRLPLLCPLLLFPLCPQEVRIFPSPAPSCIASFAALGPARCSTIYFLLLRIKISATIIASLRRRPPRDRAASPSKSRQTFRVAASVHRRSRPCRPARGACLIDIDTWVSFDQFRFVQPSAIIPFAHCFPPDCPSARIAPVALHRAPTHPSDDPDDPARAAD